jgi:hypothetical protein
MPDRLAARRCGGEQDGERVAAARPAEQRAGQPLRMLYSTLRISTSASTTTGTGISIIDLL